ncbi:MAG: hypothetical protein IJV31_11590 [Clostridia bacterium]|nr:hypothetical protein [Clostridia bacterium]
MDENKKNQQKQYVPKVKSTGNSKLILLSDNLNSAKKEYESLWKKVSNPIVKMDQLETRSFNRTMQLKRFVDNINTDLTNEEESFVIKCCIKINEDIVERYSNIVKLRERVYGNKYQNIDLLIRDLMPYYEECDKLPDAFDPYGDVGNMFLQTYKEFWKNELNEERLKNLMLKCGFTIQKIEEILKKQREAEER